MPTLFRPFLILPLLSVWLGAAPVPKAVEEHALNLQHYLEYRVQNRIALTCEETADAYDCVSSDQRITDTDGNATTVAGYKKAQLHFNAALGLLLHKDRFDATMQEIEKTEALRRRYLASQKPYIAPPSSPLQDALDRALVGNLETVNLDMFSFEKENPKTVIGIKNLSYANRMKRTAKDAAFSERIFGEIRLDYTDATVSGGKTNAYPRTLPEHLEKWFDTNNTVRAGYVGNKLGELYAEEMHAPFSGTLQLQTAYLGNDAASVALRTENRNKKGAYDTFDFEGVLQNISTIFTPARKPLTPGTPDFLFKSMHSESAADGTKFRRLLKSDKRFAGYIGEYDTLMRAAFDEKLKKFGYSPVLTGWLTRAKSAFSAIITGKADRIEISVQNRNGMTVLQVFGMLMGQLMFMPQTNALPTDSEKIFLDTAAAHLEVDIEAK